MNLTESWPTLAVLILALSLIVPAVIGGGW